MGNSNVECLNEQTDALHQIYNALLFALLGIGVVVAILVIITCLMIRQIV